jgi:uncharacterized protein (DUF302 family)
MTRDFSHSAITTLSFADSLALLRDLLHNEGFRVVAEIQFHREFERHVGLPWRSYTVLVVWNPFLAYQGVLSDRDAGIFMPFNIVVAEQGSSTLIVVTNHLLFGRLAGTVGVQVLTRDLNRKVNRVLSQMAEVEEPADNVAPQRQWKEAV